MKREINLNGRRIAVLAADGFEEVELLVPVKALEAAGAEVDIVSLRRGKIRGVNLHEPGDRIPVDRTVREADPDEYDALLIPGGFINPDLLRQSAEARNFVRAFDADRKPIASICHGPWVLASAGLLEGRMVTSWPGIRDDVVNAGATWLDREVVRDGNLLTSRGPQDIKAFSRAIRELFSEHAPIPDSAHSYADSAPQRKEPPKMLLAAMQESFLPSMGTLLGLGVLALGLATANKRRTHEHVRSHEPVGTA